MATYIQQYMFLAVIVTVAAWFAVDFVGSQLENVTMQIERDLESLR